MKNISRTMKNNVIKLLTSLDETSQDENFYLNV